MKIFHDHDENDSWTEITTIKSYPTIRNRIDETSQITFTLNDFEGALYATWEGYNFIPIKVEDDATNVLFQGYLTGKKYKHNELTCSCHGFSIRLDWVPLHKNYVLAQGLVKTVPYGGGDFPRTVTLYPDTDTNCNWTVTAGTHHDALVSISGESISVGDGEENAIEELDFGTTTGLTDVTSIAVRLYGAEVSAPAAISVDLDAGDGYIGAQNAGFGSANSWVTVTFAGLANIDQTDIDALSVKITAPAALEADEIIVIQALQVVLTATGINYYTLELETTNEGLLNWTPDQWHDEKDTAIMIRDNSDNLNSQTWECTALAFAGEDANDGVFGSVNDLYINSVSAYEDSPSDFYITPTISDAVDVIPDTQIINKIEITARFGCLNNTFYKMEMQMQVDNGGDWEDVPRAWAMSQRLGLGGAEPTDIDDLRYIEGTYTINVDCADHLTKTGADYTNIKGIRFHCTGGGDGLGTAWKCFGAVDYVKVVVWYYDVEITPIMETITDNGAEWVMGSILFGNYGVSAEDNFMIGESTSAVLYDLFARAQLKYLLGTTPTKYMAQHLKGTYCKEILKRVCLLEGVHWFEDHITREIIIAKEADMVDSTVDLTSANYAYDWEFEDDNNYYYAVEVYGTSSLAVYYIAEDASIDSPRVKTIIEETISTNAEAKEVADAKLLEYKTKRPSIKITLNGVQTDLQIGKTVHLTMERPTVGEVLYPIRMIERSRFGAGIKTTIYCGLGHSIAQEKIADIINKNAYITHKAHTDRLVSTPFSAAASFTWSDIGGAAVGAVSAVAADDAYLKNDANDETTGDLTVANLITAGLVDGVDVSVRDHAATVAGDLNHNDLANLNAGDVYEHISAAQLGALHTAVVAGDLSHNSLANLNAGDVYEHISAAQLAALHTATVAGDLSHNDLANIDAADIKHITAAQLAALHAVQAAGDFNHNSLANLNVGDLLHLTAAEYAENHEAANSAGSPIVVGAAQALNLLNEDAGVITEIDTGVLANSDTKIPTNTTVMEGIATQISTHKDLPNDHHTPTVAGDLSHNSLANIDAGDINHLTDVQVAALHAATSSAGSPIAVGVGQALSLRNDAAAAITEVDTGVLSELDTTIPTSKTVFDAIAAVEISIIPSNHMIGVNGYVNINYYGALLQVVFSDASAQIATSYFVKDGGSFKIRIVHAGSGANAGKTAGGSYWLTSDIDAGAQAWNHANGVAWNLALSNANIIDIDDSAVAYTIPDNTFVGCNWGKNDNAGGAAGDMRIYEIVLVRQ